MKAKIRLLLSGGEVMDDDQLAMRLKVGRQQVNQACRQLAQQGVIVRSAGGPDGKIVNRLSPTAPAPPVIAVHRAAAATQGVISLLTEDQLKKILEAYLADRGWAVTVMWGRARGIDLVAKGPRGRLVIEAKGEAATPQMEGNYFLGALGELVQRMVDAEAQYALALPNNRRFRGLVERLPRVARERLQLGVFFVSADGNVEFDAPPRAAE